jgi:uncharacterized integral membrane protein
MRRLLQFILIVPVVAIGLVFAVANRHIVTVSFDPFPGDVVGVQITAPLFIIFILAMMFGVLVGGIATWFTQSRNRRALREARSEAARWRSQAERLQTASAASSDRISDKFSSLQKAPTAPASNRLLVHS